MTVASSLLAEPFQDQNVYTTNSASTFFKPFHAITTQWNQRNEKINWVRLYMFVLGKTLGIRWLQCLRMNYFFKTVWTGKNRKQEREQKIKRQRKTWKSMEMGQGLMKSMEDAFVNKKGKMSSVVALLYSWWGSLAMPSVKNGNLWKRKSWTTMSNLIISKGDTST